MDASTVKISWHYNDIFGTWSKMEIKKINKGPVIDVTVSVTGYVYEHIGVNGHRLLIHFWIHSIMTVA